MLTTSNILLLEKLIHLGKKLEGTRIYELLEPWSFNGHDLYEIQEAGKRISNFIGLPNLTFVIGFFQQKKNTAGHIELNNNSEEGVFIEIDEKLKSENNIILAILAHEICHKLIHINGLTQLGYENEILTDVATVFTGLGKLSLNGCESKKVFTDTALKENIKTTTKTTTTKTIGYLKRDQFAFLYNVVCNMRKIPIKYASKGLNKEAINAIKRNQYYHSAELFHNVYARKNISEINSQFNHKYQLESAKNLKLFKTLQASVNNEIKKNKSTHQLIKSTSEKHITKASENLTPERLNYIKNLILINELNSFNQLYKDKITEFAVLNNAIIRLLQRKDLAFLLKLEDREIFYKIECPVCANTMSLKQDKLVKINCTRCRYSFIVDNSKIDNHEGMNKQLKPQKTITKKLKEIIAIMKK